MARVLHFFLKQYENASYEMRKKSLFFFILVIVAMMVLLSVTTLEIIFGFPWTTWLPFVAGALYCGLSLFLLKIRRYETASSMVFIGIFVTMTVALCLDFYDNPFDIYRYAFVITTLIIISSVLSYNQFQVIFMTVVGEIGIVFFYIFRFGYQLGKPFEKIALISLFACIIVYGFFGVMSFIILRITKQMIEFAVENEKNAIREKETSLKQLDILSIYTKPSLVEKIHKGDDPTQLAPENKELSILFCDIRDFTRISENLEPGKVVEILNPYFAVMNSIIMDFRGEVDKLMGDCIMAVFNTPDDAMGAAIQMREALRSDLGMIDVKIRNGIGIHFGKVITGNIGSPWKMDNTVIGDIVNMASRLEALNKVYHAGIIISDYMFDKLQNKYCLTPLDIITVKGKTRPTQIYGYFDDPLSNDDPQCQQLKIELNEAFKHYTEGRFNEAHAIYQKLFEERTGSQEEISDSNLYLHFLINRCAELEVRQKNGELKNWNGIYEFKS